MTAVDRATPGRPGTDYRHIHEGAMDQPDKEEYGLPPLIPLQRPSPSPCRELARDHVPRFLFLPPVFTRV